MAKTINLTVKVDDTDFKRFITNFNAFKAQIGQLNKNFQQVNTTIQKTQANASSLLTIFQSSYTAVNKLVGVVDKVYRGFLRWGVAIGGIVSMLTTGAGMFGIDRLAESIMRQRRTAMGLGTTYGGMQGVRVAGRSFMEDPLQVLRSLADAMGGGPGLGAAATLGAGPGLLEETRLRHYRLS